MEINYSSHKMSQRRRKLEPIFLFFVKIRYFSCKLKIIGNRIDLASNCDVLDCSVVAPCHLLMKSSTKDWVLVRNIVGKTFRCYYSNRQYFSSYKLFIRRNSGLLVQHLDNLENAIKKKRRSPSTVFPSKRAFCVRRNTMHPPQCTGQRDLTPARGRTG